MNFRRIKDLVKQVKEACREKRYRELKSLWERHRRGEIVEKIPLIMSMDPIWWARKLGYDMESLVFDVEPEVAIEFQLKQKLFHHRNIPDDTVIIPDITTLPTWMPTITPFGSKYSYDFATGSWKLPSLIEKKEDLDKLSLTSFNKEKYWGEKERSLKKFNEILDGEIPVRYSIPEENAWFGPFACAQNIYGMTNTLMALAEDPPFIHRLMEFITQSRLKYEEEKAKVLGTKLIFLGLTEDEVDCNMLSPEMYQEFIFPYECRIAEKFKKVYYHSCGNLTPILDIVTTLPNLWKLHISSWTDLEVAVQKIPKEIILEKHLLATDIFQTTCGEMEKKIREITSLAKNRSIEIHVSSIMEGKTEKISTWLSIARRYTSTL